MTRGEDTFQKSLRPDARPELPETSLCIPSLPGHCGAPAEVGPRDSTGRWGEGWGLGCAPSALPSRTPPSHSEPRWRGRTGGRAGVESAALC